MKLNISRTNPAQITVRFSENSSGGRFQLNAEQYALLTVAGWVPDGPPLLGLPAMTKTFGIFGKFDNRRQVLRAAEDLAREEFERITHEDPYLEVCECCGPNYGFYASTPEAWRGKMDE